MKESLRGPGRVASFVGRHSPPLVFAAVLAALVGSAQGAPSTKFYSASAQGTVPAGGSAPVLLTLTNVSPDSTQTLGSANFTPPSQLTATTASQTVASGAGKQWGISASAGVIQFRAKSSGDAIAPGDSVSASVTVSAPGCATGAFKWTTQAKQSNAFNGSGNDFALKPPGGEPQTQVTSSGGAPDHLAFGQQPTTTATNAAISPAVTVRVFDACGNVATSATGSVSIAIGANPSGGSLNGTTPKSVVNGVATFTDVSIDTSGLGYTLTASKTGLSSTTSQPFNVFDFVCTVSPCRGHDADSNTFAEITFNSGSMGLSFESPGQNVYPGCGGGTLEPVGSVSSIVPDAVSGTKTVVLRYSKAAAPGTGVANFVQCFSTDGDVWTQLGDCGKRPHPPCVSKKNRNGVGELVVEVLLPAGDPKIGTGFG